MDKLITETFELDELKFSGDLGDQYLELFSSLEKLAFAMQLMQQQSFNDRSEYQALLSHSQRDLIKKSGLLKREGTNWKFLHNNFREYLTARFLSHLPKDFVVSIFYDGTNIKPNWVNTLGYLTGFDLSWSLIDWLIENSPSALVKFESDRLPVELRIEIFKRIFAKFELLRLHFNDDLCDEAELAHFVNSNEILSFLLDRISTPKHHMSQYMAVNILRHYPSLFGKENTVRDILLTCCNQYPVTPKETCRLAIFALCQHKLYTPETTHRLMEKFRDIDEDYIRLGMYEYLLETKEHNSYVEYCLSGIHLITYKLDNEDNVRIGNESFELVNCLKNMSTVESIIVLLKWFSQEKHPDFHDSDKVLECIIKSAITLYKEGHLELFDSILPLYLESAEIWNTTTSNAMVKFFVETGTQYTATLSAATRFEDKPHHYSDLVYSDWTIIEYLKTSYLDGSLKSHHAFHKFVLWYVRDELKYMEYADLIKTTDGIELPEYKAPIDYESLNRKSKQEYFDSLFDAEKRQRLMEQLIKAIGNPNLTTRQLLETNINIDHHSPLSYLRMSMYHYGSDINVSEFFSQINIDHFVLRSASRFLSEKSIVIPTQAQKQKLMEIVANIIKSWNFKNSVIYRPNGFSLKSLTKELVSLIQYLDYPLSETMLLDLTELPSFLFNKNNEKAKYVYLQQKLTIEKLKLRMVQNVRTQQVKSMVLHDHITFFDNCKDSSLAEYALVMCRDKSDPSLRSLAWRYLYNTLGSEYITDEILPIADDELLIDICGTCKNLSKTKLRDTLERQYKKTPSIQLQQYLISLGSSIALKDYAIKVSSDNCPPEGTGVHIDGPTTAISSICDPTFLPQLESLLITVINPDFKDCTWHSLRNSLSKAFVSCGTIAYDEAIKLLTKHRPSAEADERNYRYCNYIINDIEHTRKSLFDVPKTLTETQALIDEAQKHYKQ